MSTFDDVIKEYHLISIDNFLEKSSNFQSTVFFLSHCYEDHMRGLANDKFFDLLESRGFSRIYVSGVSEHLLKNDEKYRHLSKYLVSLPLEHPTILDIYDEGGTVCSRIVVTLLTAGHCPGSVMFLLEGENGRVLYTGDFRIPIGGSARMPDLHDKNGRLKPIDSLYIDTTFCTEDYLYIPAREECLKEILKIVENWLSKGPDHIVRFVCPAKYAYEFVFVEIFKQLGEKTHVFEDKLKKYKGIKVIEDAVTSIPNESRVHACYSGHINDFLEAHYDVETPCGYHLEDFRPIKVKLIKPCAMSFKDNKFTELSMEDDQSNLHRVCFSTHSSLEEIRDMVRYLEPSKVYPNVVHKICVEQILYLIGAGISRYSPKILPLGQLKDDFAIDEFPSPSTNSLPFFDDCYQIQRTLPPKSLVEEYPIEREMISTQRITELNSPNEKLTQKENLVLLTNGKTATARNWHINNKLTQSESSSCLTNKKIESASRKSNCDSSSPLKWKCPVFSSEDENSDPNSPLKVEKEISISDTISSSDEQNSPSKYSGSRSSVTKLSRGLKILHSEESSSSEEENSPEIQCLASTKSKQAQSDLPSTNNRYTEQNFQTQIRSGIRFELEKLLFLSQDVRSGVDSSSRTSTSCGNSFERAHLNVTTTSKTCNESIATSSTYHIYELNSKTYCINKDAPKELTLKSDDLLKQSSCKQDNLGKADVKINAFQSETSWRGSKLLLDDEGCGTTSDVDIFESPTKVKNKREDVTKLETNDLNKKYNHQAENVVNAASFPKVDVQPSQIPCTYDIQNNRSNVTFQPIPYSNGAIQQTNCSKDVIQPSQIPCTFEGAQPNQISLASVAVQTTQSLYNTQKHASKSQKFLGLSQFLGSPHLNRTLSKSDSSGSSETSVKSMSTIGRRKTKRSTTNKKPAAAKYQFCNDQSQYNFRIIGCPNSKNSLSELSSFIPSFSKKPSDLFASKYERSISNRQRTAPVPKDSKNDIIVLPNLNKYDKTIKLVDISSEESVDGYTSDVDLFDDQNRASEQKTDIRVSPKIEDQTQEPDVVKIEDDSPSLLTTNKQPKFSFVDLLAPCETIGPGRKRKSADESVFASKKSPKHESNFDSPPICDDDCDISSTPEEDLLLFTHSKVCSYLKKILGPNV